MPLISLIVPFHNEEPYLSRSIRSIHQQTFIDFEVLLIDDFSNDGSYALARRMTQGDERFRLIRNTEKGLYHARNLALGLALGQYICFLDADDVILPNYLSSLYADAISGNADLVVHGISHLNGSLSYNVTASTPGSFNLDDEAQVAFSYFDVASLGNVVGKLFSRKLIIDHHLTFSPHVYMCEDLYFTVSYLAFTHSLILSTASHYQYIAHDRSMSAHYWSYPKERQSFDALICAWNNLMSAHGCPALLASFGSFYGTYLHRLVFSCLTHPDSHVYRAQYLKEIEDTYTDQYRHLYHPSTRYTHFLKWAIMHHHYRLYLLSHSLAALRYGIQKRYI